MSDLDGILCTGRKICFPFYSNGGSPRGGEARLMPSSHYPTSALIFKSPTGLMSSPARVPDQRQIVGGSGLPSRRGCRGVVRELFKDARREARRCVPDTPQISGVLNTRNALQDMQ